MSKDPYLLKRMRSAADEAASPKYAHLERERRWRVDPMAIDNALLMEPIEIVDRYILQTRMRLRRMEHSGQTVWKLTRKYESEDPLARPIVTAYLVEEEYEVLARLPAVGLSKTRYKIRDDAHDFSIDRFAGQLDGMWLSEIELEDGNELAALQNPSWTIAEVTSDPRYQGFNLAQSGIPKD